jgi:hypothetical protein
MRIPVSRVRGESVAAASLEEVMSASVQMFGFKPATTAQP